jgi:hypothetical protein
VVLWRPEGLVKRRPTGTGRNFFDRTPGKPVRVPERSEPVAAGDALARQAQS